MANALIFLGRQTNSSADGPYFGYITPKNAVHNDMAITATAVIAVPPKPLSGTNRNRLCFELRRSGSGATLSCYRISIVSQYAYNATSVSNYWQLDQITDGSENYINSGNLSTFSVNPNVSTTYVASIIGIDDYPQITLTATGSGGSVIDWNHSHDALIGNTNCAIGFDARGVDGNTTPLVTVTGVSVSGLTTVDIYRSPQAMLSWSDDGGFTWNGERWEDIGKIGEYYTRMHWHRLGSSRNRVFKMVISDPVKRVLIASHVTIEQETA
jgi:hypothetical protein